MPLSKEKLLEVRFKVINRYPDMPCKVGHIFCFTPSSPYIDYYMDYPHLFQKLKWWEDREFEDLPTHVRDKNDGRILELIGITYNGHYKATVRGVTNEWYMDFEDLVPEDHQPEENSLCELQYVPEKVFNELVKEYAKENSILTRLFNHPNSKVKTWEDLAPHLIQDLFKRLNCKPIIYKY